MIYSHLLYKKNRSNLICKSSKNLLIKEVIFIIKKNKKRDIVVRDQVKKTPLDSVRLKKYRNNKESLLTETLLINRKIK